MAYGASAPTDDLDTSFDMTPRNLARLMEALAPYHQKYATRPDLGIIEDSPERLSKYRLLLFETDFGRLDVLWDVVPLGAFDKLNFVEMELLENRRFRVLTLADLI